MVGRMVTKLYCYVDEAGQHTRGDLFIVSVVVTDRDRDKYRCVCEMIEQKTGKGRAKWIKTPYSRRVAYIQQMLENPLFRGRLSFAVYRHTTDYQDLVARTIVGALENTKDYQATVLIDALPRRKERAVGLYLRKKGIRAKKVRGVRKDENDALIRLADAICGLVRTAIEENPTMRDLLTRGVEKGVLRDLTGQ